MIVECQLWLLTAGAEAAEKHGFGLNFDILEANLINLAIVVGVLVYFGRGFLGGILSDRRSKIEEAILAAEKRQKTAAAELADQQQKLAQAQAEATRIRKSAEENAVAAKQSIMEQAEQDIERLRESVSQDVNAEQERAIAELRQRVTILALQKAEGELPSRMNDDLQQQLIDRSITMLGGAS